MRIDTPDPLTAVVHYREIYAPYDIQFIRGALPKHLLRPFAFQFCGGANGVNLQQRPGQFGFGQWLAADDRHDAGGAAGGVEKRSAGETFRFQFGQPAVVWKLLPDPFGTANHLLGQDPLGRAVGQGILASLHQLSIGAQGDGSY